MGRTDSYDCKFQQYKCRVVICSSTKAKCGVYVFTIATCTRSQFLPYIYYIILWVFLLNRSIIHNFVIGKDLLFQSPSRHINRKHCKCCIHQGLVINACWTVHSGLVLLGIYRLRRYLVHMCIRFILGWMVQG